MKIRYLIAAGALAVGLTAFGVAAAIDGGDDDDTTTATSTTTVVADDDGYIGLAESVAVERAVQEGREWRISRRDGESFVLTDDLVPGRATFEIDDGLVTAVSIEQVFAPGPDPRPRDEVRAALLADALERLTTVDNSFGGGDVFDEFLIGSSGEENAVLYPIDHDFITASLGTLGNVVFVSDPDAEMEALFGEPIDGTAVLSVERVLLLDDRAEVELHLWCGSLCGVFVTYEAVPVDGGWEITGPAGPIAVS